MYFKNSLIGFSFSLIYSCLIPRMYVLIFNFTNAYFLAYSVLIYFLITQVVEIILSKFSLYVDMLHSLLVTDVIRSYSLFKAVLVIEPST